MRRLPPKFLAAMIGVRALPGSPGYGGSESAVIEAALSDLEHYRNEGVDAVLLENSHDLPYIKPPLAESAKALMASIAQEVRRRFSGPVGIQMLEAANECALEIAHAADLDFVRVEGYVFAHIGGAGLIEGCAGHLLRRRAALESTHIRVFADLKKKHCSHAITADLTIVDVLRQAEFFLADGVVITGPRTGEPPDLGEVAQVGELATVPVLIGSGITADNLAGFLPAADGFIVGSTFREKGAFLGALAPDRLRRFMDTFRKQRETAPMELRV